MCCKTSVNMLANVQESCFLMHYCVRKKVWVKWEAKSSTKAENTRKEICKEFDSCPRGNLLISGNCPWVSFSLGVGEEV